MKYSRPSTFNWWVSESSGNPRNISVKDFLQENPGYKSGYEFAYDKLLEFGCKLISGLWLTPDKKKFNNVFDALEYMEIGEEL